MDISKKIKTAANDYIKGVKKRIAKRKDEINEAVSAANDGTPPNMDANGRLHAPVDGYIFVHPELGDLVYGKGEFLPNLFEDDEEAAFGGVGNFNFLHKQRFKFAGKELKAVTALEITGVRINAGSSWTDRVTKLTTAYVYIESASKGLLNVVAKQIAEHFEQAKEHAKKKIKAAKGTAPSGKQTVRGKVVTIKGLESTYGYNQVDWKMLVELESGATVWGSVPAAFLGMSESGLEVEFTATFEQAQDDETHAFYKRPTKLSVLTKAADKYTELVYFGITERPALAKITKEKAELYLPVEKKRLVFDVIGTYESGNTEVQYSETDTAWVIPSDSKVSIKRKEKGKK